MGTPKKFGVLLYSTEPDAPPQDRALSSMTGLSSGHQDPEPSLPCALHSPSQPCSWEEEEGGQGGQPAGGPSSASSFCPLRGEQGLPNPWEQEVGEKATPGHTTLYCARAPPLINVAETVSWILTKQITAATWREASRGEGRRLSLPYGTQNPVSFSPHNFPFQGSGH